MTEGYDPREMPSRMDEQDDAIRRLAREVQILGCCCLAIAVILLVERVAARWLSSVG